MVKLTHTIEQWQLDDAARLKRLFSEKSHLNQTSFGAEYRIGNQGYVWQLLNGRRPLNIKTALAFSQGLGVPIDAFSPTLAQIIAKASAQIEPHAASEEHVPIYFVDTKASARSGRIVISKDVINAIVFRRDWLEKNDVNPDETLAFQVESHSTTDTRSINDTVVLANQRMTDPVSSRVYVLWIDGQLHVKQLVKQGGLWYAKPHSFSQADQHPNIQIDIDDKIVGRAFWCGFSL